MTPSVESWFDGWLGSHKCWNSGPGWNRFESDENAFTPWMKSFQRHQVIEGEAVEASLMMAEEESRFPEDHLPRLLTLIRQARAERVAAAPMPNTLAEAEAKRREEVSAIVEAEWLSIDEASRESYRRLIRDASPDLGRHRLGVVCVEALAKQVHAESVRPELRPPPDRDGRPGCTLEGLRRNAGPPEMQSIRASIPPVSPPILTAEQERAARERADGIRRAQVSLLRAMERSRPAPPKPQHTAPEARSPHDRPESHRRGARHRPAPRTRPGDRLRPVHAR